MVDGGRAVRRVECQMKCDGLEDAARFQKSKTLTAHFFFFSYFLTTAAVFLSECGIDKVSPAASSSSPSQRWRRRSKSCPSPWQRRRTGRETVLWRPGEGLSISRTPESLNDSTTGGSVFRLGADMSREHRGKIRDDEWLNGHWKAAGITLCLFRIVSGSHFSGRTANPSNKGHAHQNQPCLQQEEPSVMSPRYLGREPRCSPLPKSSFNSTINLRIVTEWL